MFKRDMKIAGFDDEIWSVIEAETARQEDHIELIASENYTSPRVIEAQGSVLTNKYAEGYPGKRYYGGCEHVDVAESLAIERAKTLFGAAYANVQPHSGSQANAAVYMALVNPGDTVLGMSLADGGHLTHGASVNFSGKIYNAVQYGLNKETGLIDYDEVERLADQYQPKMIVAGFSAYSQPLDFARFRHCGQSRRLSAGRHGPRGWSGRRWGVSRPCSSRPRCDHHDAQDPARSSRRSDPRL